MTDMPLASGSAQARWESGRVSGQVPTANLHAGQVGIVLDGVLRHAVAATPDGPDTAAFSFDLAGLSLAATLELEELATGRRLLAQPLAVPDGFRLDALRFEETFLVGAFSLSWAPHPLLPVAFAGETDPASRGVADHQPIAAAEVGDVPALPHGRATYGFRVPLSVLPAGPLAVVPVVGGVARPDATHTLSCPFAGYVDSVEGPHISGWVADTVEPGRPVRVEAWRGGRLVASATTALPRQDVAQAIPGADLCGFAFTVPVSERMRDGQEPYRVVVAGTDTLLRDGVVQVAPMPGRLNRLDGVAGGVVTGWALDGSVDGPVTVEVLRDGVAVASGPADQFRADLAAEGLGAAGLPPGCCAFAIRVAAAADAVLEVRAGGHALDGSPVTVAPNPNLLRFRDRRRAVSPAMLPRLRAALDRAVGLRSVSLVLPVLGTDPATVAAVLDAVAAQWCSRWELLCVHDGFAEPATARIVAQSARRDPRIRLVPAVAADGAAAFLAAGLQAARSGYVAVLRPGDRPEPDAVYQMLRAVRDTGADALFTDACTTDAGPAAEPAAGSEGGSGSGQVQDIVAQTAFSVDRFRSAPFWPDLLCVRTGLAQSLPAADGIAFAAAVFAAAEKVAHVPAVAISRPAAAPPEAGVTLPSAFPAAGLFTGTLLVLVAAATAPDWLTGIGLDCRVAVLGDDPFPSAVNAAVLREGEGCAALLLLGAGVARPGEGVLGRLLSLLARTDVAVAGPVLAGPTGHVAAAGLVLSPAEGVVPGFAGCDLSRVGDAVRNVSALPGTFLLVRTDAWAEAGGYNPDHAPGLLCDADLCLRLEATGRAVLLDGSVSVQAPVPAVAPADHAWFAAFHAGALRRGDPWYSPFLAPDGSWLLRSDDNCRTVHPARVVTARPRAAQPARTVAEPAEAAPVARARGRSRRGAKGVPS